MAPIVREFYTSAFSRDDSVSIVRGERMNYSRARINVFFGLNNINNNSYKAKLNLPISVDLVTSVIATNEEASWIYHNN